MLSFLALEIGMSSRTIDPERLLYPIELYDNFDEYAGETCDLLTG